MALDGVTREIDVGSVIDQARAKILNKEFGPPLPPDRVMTMKREVQSRLNEAPLDGGKFSDLFSSKVLRYTFIGNEGEFFTVDLHRSISAHPGNEADRDEIRVHRWFVQPVMEWRGNGMVEGDKTSVTSQDLGFVMLDTPGSDTLPTVNLHGDNMDKNNEVNLSFVGECAMNGVSQEELKGLSLEERNKLGMFRGGDGIMAERELRDNWEDQTALALIEKALVEGEQITLNELYNLQAQLAGGSGVKAQ